MSFIFDRMLRTILDGALMSAITLCWVLAFGTDAGHAQDKKQERLHREAIALFSVILNEKNVENERINKEGRCAIFNEWTKDAIEEEDARKFFGVKAHAKLSTPETGTHPAEILDPKKLHANVFCNSDETKTNSKKRFVEFKSAYASGKLGQLSITQWAYSFPIFNENYTRAELVITDTGYAWISPDSDGVAGASQYAYIYEKRHGGWVRVYVDVSTAGGGVFDLEEPPPLDP